MYHISYHIKFRPITKNVKRYSSSSTQSAPMVMKTPVGNTALWVAHIRGVEYHRSDAIVKDQFAEILSGSEGKQIYDHYTKFVKMSGRGIPKFEKTIEQEFHDSIACRCRFYDDMVLSLSAGKCKQVVILASGLDSRAFRLNWSPNVRVFELDRKEVLDFKLNKLKQLNAMPTCHNHIPIDADLTEQSWPQKMKDNGFDPQLPSVWLAEGLLGYIPENGVKKLLQTCSSLSPPGSSIGGDIAYVPSFFRNTPLFEEAKRLGNPFLFFTKNPEILLKDCGWPNVKVNMKGER